LDYKYATASAEWQQVIRPETAKFIHHIGIYIYMYACVSVFVFEFYTSLNSVSLELLLSFSILLIFKVIFYI
jgi:CMP-2-keto-3-deoxyoctulosonic acid synthetase